MNHVARTNLVQQLLRIVRMRRIFHPIEVIKIAEEFIEAVDRGQEVILVAKMVLAELSGNIALRLQRGSNGTRLSWNLGRRTRLADRRHTGSDRQFAGDKVSSPRGTTRFR